MMVTGVFTDSHGANEYTFSAGFNPVTRVKVCCSCPPIHLILFRYTFYANKYNNLTYFNHFVEWNPKDYSSSVAKRLYHPQSIAPYLNPLRSLKDIPLSLDLNRDDVFTYMHFGVLEQLYMLTGKRIARPLPEVMNAIANEDYNRLIDEFSVPIRTEMAFLLGGDSLEKKAFAFTSVLNQMLIHGVYIPRNARTSLFANAQDHG
jgi:hypothetical protein